MTTPPPKAHHSMTEGAQKQETGSALHSRQAAQQIGRGLSFLDSSAKLCFLQSAWLLRESSRQLSWFHSVSAIITAYICFRREGPSESGQFHRLPEAILSCLLPVLMSFPAGWGVAPPLGASYCFTSL